MAPSHETSTQPAVRSDLYFGPFRLESTKRLWRGERLVRGAAPAPGRAALLGRAAGPTH